MIKKRYVISLLIALNICNHSVDSLLETVIDQYETALQDLLDVYQAMQPPLPIQFNQSDAVGATYHKILWPYVVEIKGFANAALLAYSRKIPYDKDLQKLQAKFQQVNQKVITLTKLFPEEVQQDALYYFYNQLTDSLVQNCVKILQGLAYSLNTDSQALENALITYNLAWAVQTPTMKLTEFSDTALFRANVTTWMLTLYEGALVNLTAQLQKTDNKLGLYDQIESCYMTLFMVYTNSGNAQKAAVEKQNALNVQTKKQQFVQASSMVQKGQQKAEAGRVKVIIDYVQPAASIDNVKNVLQDISDAYQWYNKALTLYTTLQDDIGINQCRTQIEQLQGDFVMLKIPYLWLMFFNNSYRPGISLTTNSFSNLQNFYTLNPSSDHISTTNVIDSLTEILDLCTQTPNNFDANLAILPLLKSAISSYQGAMIVHSDDQNQDYLADTTMLQDLQKALQAFVEILQGMIAISQGQQMISGSNILAQLMVQAKEMDLLLSQNSELKNFLFYFPDIEVDMVGKKSYQSFIIQYIYRIVLSKVQAYVTQATDQGSQNDKAMMLGLSDVITLQEYKDYITADQLAYVQKVILSLASVMNIEEYAQTVYKNAQNSNNWVNVATIGHEYQSETDSLWNTAIQLCEIGIDLSRLPDVDSATHVSTGDLQKVYAAVLSDYVKAFIKNAPISVGYQLPVFIALYKLRLVGTQLQDQVAINFANKTLEQLFGGANGFFTQVQQIVTSLHNNKMTSSQKSEQEHIIAQLMAQIHVVIEQQSLAIHKMVELFTLPQEPEPLLSAVVDSVYMTLTMKLGSNSYTVQLVNPVAIKINRLEDQITSTKVAAEHAEEKQDFVSAMALYSDIKNYCLTLLPLLENSEQEQTYKDIYFLANTRFTASSLVSQIFTKNVFSLHTLKNIPKQYFIQNYRLNNIDMQILGGIIPASLQPLKNLTILSKAQKKDALAIFKAYLIAQLLQPQGLTFLSCYSDYTLQKLSGLSSQNMEIITDAEAVVTAYLKEWKNIGIAASVQGTTIHFVLEQLPVASVVPLYPAGPYAAIYFMGASQLFKPGTQLVDGGQYVPGQDQTSYQLMLEYIAKAYISAAQKQMADAQSKAQALIADMSIQIKVKKMIDDATFMKRYNKIKEGFLGAQALLFAAESSAYYYFGLAEQTEQAAITKAIYLESYSVQINLLKQMLVGSPVSHAYNTILSDLNQAYVSWCVELDPNKDADLIIQNQQAVVALFQTAGDACMNYEYTQTMFPNMQQYHYMTAASNYEAAKQEYTSMLKDKKRAAEMRDKALQAYFFACTQKMAVYYYAQQRGVVYKPISMIGYDEPMVTQPAQISFSDLFAAYQSFENGGNPNQGKIDAYNDLLKLLLDSAMYFQYLAGVYVNAQAPAKTTHGSLAKHAPIDATLLTYLQAQNIISAQGDSVPYLQTDILSKLFALADTIFIKYQNNITVLADWCNILYTAIQYQYINDYQGGIDPKSSAADQATEFMQKWQSFSIAIQKEASALENPSSAYVG